MFGPKCSYLGVLIAIPFVTGAYSEPLRFNVQDPVGDSSGNGDMTIIMFDLDNQTGGSRIELIATADKPFV